MSEDYISGYLQAIAHVKDIVHKGLGGDNGFFSIPKDPQKSLVQNIQHFLFEQRAFYDAYRKYIRFEDYLKKVDVEEIVDWEQHLQPLLSEWTSDAALVAIHGKNGYFLSEQLVDAILKSFFKGQTVDAFKLLPEYGDWPWCGHQISKAFVFENRKGIWVMSFGMSS